jgi:hypothetical protein
MTLETLVNAPDAPLPLLLSSISWLINNQYQRDGDDEDGNWKKGHTARIALSLIEYYKKTEHSFLSTR